MSAESCNKKEKFSRAQKVEKTRLHAAKTMVGITAHRNKGSGGEMADTYV